MVCPALASQDAVPASRKARNVAIITIHGPIDAEGVMAASVQRRVDTAVRAGADALVFDINTPGGEVGSVLRICNTIKQSQIKNTVAWINPDAYSGGAIIALACRELVVNDPATLGDAMPVGMGNPLTGPTATNDREILKKILPPLISEVVDSARRYNSTFGGYFRDEYLVQAIVANDVELWRIRNKATGAEMCIDRREFELLFPGQSPESPPRLASAPGTGRGRPANPAEVPAPLPGTGVDVPSGSRKLAIASAEAVVNLPGQRPILSAADVGAWELVDKVTDGSAPALFKAADLLHYGLADNDTELVNGIKTLKPIRTDEDIRAFFGADHIRRFDRTWSEGLVLFLTNFFVRGVLIVVFLIALFVEITHPGTFLAGIVSLLALIALLGPPMLIGLASWWEIAAILLGILLLGIEAFVTPGFGVAGIAGLFLLFVGLIATFVPSGGGPFPDTPYARNDMLWGAVTLILSFSTAGVGMYFVAKHFGSIPVIGKLVLKSPSSEDDADGFFAAMGEDQTAPVKVGDVGTALTPLRPAGRVQVGETVIDAAAEFGFVPAGAKVRISSVTPMRIGVEVIA